MKLKLNLCKILINTVLLLISTNLNLRSIFEENNKSRHWLKDSLSLKYRIKFANVQLKVSLLNSFSFINCKRVSKSPFSVLRSNSNSHLVIVKPGLKRIAWYSTFFE